MNRAENRNDQYQLKNFYNLEGVSKPPINQKITVSNNPFNNDHNKRTTTQAQQKQQQQEQDDAAKGGVTKGWDFLATVFSASVSLKEGGSKVRSKEAPALLITTTGSSGFLDIPTIKTA